jgi:hypothetical protein
MGIKSPVAASLAGSATGIICRSHGYCGKKIKHGPEKHAFQTLKGEKITL